MTKTQIFDFAITLLGIYVFVSTLRNLVFYGSYFSFNSFSDVNFSKYIFGFVEYIVLMLFSLILIFKTRLVIKLFHKPEEEELTLQISLTDKSLVYEVAIVIIGLVSIMYTLPNLVVEIDKFLTNKNQYLNLHKSEFILTIMKLVMGFFAIVFSKDIGRKIGEK